jgi:hypothetical protein
MLYLTGFDILGVIAPLVDSYTHDATALNDHRAMLLLHF